MQRLHNVMEARQDQIVDEARGIVSFKGYHERVSQMRVALVSHSHTV
jgi:hypothetical protein